MKASDYIVSFLEAQGVRVIFGYQGGMITHIVDAISKNANLQFIQTYHEQTAAIAAEGYAVANNSIGVAIATSGPGATNLITGIADAYFDSIPVLYITGQVNTYESKNGRPVRQLGFQELDIVEMVNPITKLAVRVESADDLPRLLTTAVQTAISGRKGPVLLDIPMNIQREEILQPVVEKRVCPLPFTVDKTINFKDIVHTITQAKCPIFILGGGVNNSECKEIIQNVVKKYSFPVVYSLKGKSVLLDTNNLNIGMIGAYGIRCANMALSNADVIIAIGTRLDTRQTGANISSFCTNATIIHVDIDPDEIEHHRLTNRLKVMCDALTFMDKLQEFLPANYITPKKWIDFLQEVKHQYNQKSEIIRIGKENTMAYLAFQCINEKADQDSVYVADIGQNQMWAAQSINIDGRQEFWTSGGMAPMGFSIPFAIGYAFAKPGVSIFSICGDGGFHIALQALQLISQYDLAITILVINNRSLGMITQFQSLYFDSNYVGTKRSGGYISPDIKQIAKAYDLPYHLVEENHYHDIPSINSRNAVIEVIVDDKSMVFPKLEYNQNFDNPSPQLLNKDIPKYIK